MRNATLHIPRWQACMFAAGLAHFFIFCCEAQDQKMADSLSSVYRENTLADSSKLELLWELCFNEVSDLNLALRYADELIQLSQKKENYLFLYRGFLLRGNKEKLLGNLERALDAYFRAAEAATKGGNNTGMGNTYSAIAAVYRVSDNHQNAMHYYHKAIAILKQAGQSVNLASTTMNAGEALRIKGDYDSALWYFTESGRLFEILNSQTGKAYNLGNTGMVYAALGNSTLAERKLNEAITILEGLGDHYPICSYLISMAGIYQNKKDLPTALGYAQRSLKLAQQYSLKEQVSDACLTLSGLHEEMGNASLSLQFFRDHIAYRDSVSNVKTIQKIADQRTQFEVSLREKEINLLEQSKKINQIYFLIALILLILAVMILLYFRQRLINTRLIAGRQQKLHEEKIGNLLREHEAQAMQSLFVGREMERKQIAQDLHNHLGSLLATIKVNLSCEKEENMRNYRTITALVDQACSDIRSMSHSLNMGISDDFGLIPAIRDLVQHIKRSGNLEVEFHNALTECQLDSASEIIVYRIVQELISNILKHAQASKISVSLTCYTDEHMVNIMVQDDGKGFSLKEVEEGSKHDGMGLANIKKIVKQQRGDIHIDSNSQSGTTVSIDLPINSNF